MRWRTVNVGAVFASSQAPSAASNAAPTFTVRHRVDAHLFTPWPADAASTAPARAWKGFCGRAD